MTDRATDRLVIREATDDDLSTILELYADPDMDDGDVLTEQEARETLEALSTHPDHRVYVAVLDAEPVGTFTLLIMPCLGSRGRPAGVLEDLVVTAGRRGAGIGEALIGEAIRLCRAKGCYKLTLSSDLRRTGAHAFYDRLGFERHGYSFRIPV